MSLRVSAKKLREKRATILTGAGALLTLASQEDRDLTTEERTKFDGAHAEGDALLIRITDMETQIDATVGFDQVVRTGVEDDELEIDAPGGDNPELSTDERTRLEAEYTRMWMAGGHAHPRMTDAHRDAYKDMLEGNGATNDTALRARVNGGISPTEQRAMGAEAANLGLETVPEGFWNVLTEAKLAFGGMNNLATVIRTGSGNDLPFPTSDDTAEEGEIIAENAPHNEQDVATANIILQAFTYSSKIVRVSVQLLQDSAFNMNEFLARKLGERLARIQNRHYTTGTGAGEPNGVVTASPVGETAALALALTHPELLNLKHSVDPSYRNNGAWQFHDDTLRFIKGLVDLDDRPLWQAGIAVGEPDRIDGDPYQINQHMDVIAAANDVITYGDHKQYYIREVTGVVMLRLVERYAENLQVGFLAYQRSDGDLIDAGTNPVKKLRMAP